MKRAAVVGLGTVGVPLALKCAEAGLHTVGLERDAAKVEALNRGEYPLPGHEPGIRELLTKVHRAKTFRATTEPEQLRGADVLVIAVETPFDDAKQEPDYRALRSACEALAPRLARGALVIVESTVAPRTTEDVVRPLLEKGSGLRAPADFFLGHCPERVTPGKLLHNLVNMGRVVGGLDGESTKRMLSFYKLFVKGDLVPTDARTAEVVKTVENAYRDVEIAFANEIAQACEALGVDAWQVRELVNQVPYRNMHQPGVGVGGHCLPKDPLLLAHAVKGRVDARLLLTARQVNDSMPARTAQLVVHTLERAGARVEGAVITLLGAAYNPNTSDTRNSPALRLARELRKRGAVVRLADPFASNLEEFPVEEDVHAALRGADAAVLVTAHDAYRDLDWAAAKKVMRHAVLVDGRGVVNPSTVKGLGFAFAGVGRA